MAIHTLEEAIAHDFWIACVARDEGRRASRRPGARGGKLADETGPGVVREYDDASERSGRCERLDG